VASAGESGRPVLDQGVHAGRRLLEAGSAGIPQQGAEQPLHVPAGIARAEKAPERGRRAGRVGGVHDVRALVHTAVDQRAVEVEGDGSFLHDGPLTAGQTTRVL
jgi:hypothetical protein